MSFTPEPRKKRGFAILLVLGALSLLVVLVLTFLESVKNEGLSASIYAGQLEARRAATSALELVMAQIQEASENSSGVWTSQPGLIRVHQAGGKQTVYKLYSANPATMKSDGYSPKEDDIGFHEGDGEVVDINRPIFYKGNKIFPILDPAIYSGDKSLVDGFENTRGSSEEAFQMNVRWMYLLENGKLVSQGELDDRNPPISRFAFWVDDESCKVNVNTASEGVYWSVPRTDSQEDVDFSLNIPALNEYQRYPGHPAMTSLSPILTGRLLGGEFEKQGLDYQSLIYGLIPRIAQGGSMGGTVTPKEAVTQDSDRLFGFVDDLVFKASNDPRQMEFGKINPEKVGALSFFLTANSRAPEETINSTPRVSIWPLHTNSAWWTAAEKMIGFCSKLNGNLYGFQRQKSLDSSFDYSGIPRNKELYAYLQSQIAKKPPYLERSLKEAWGDDADQNLTEIFDYIRSGPALQNPKLEQSYTNQFNYDNHRAASGSVSPIIIGSTKGFGRSLTISQVGFVFTNILNNYTVQGNAATPLLSSDVGITLLVQFFNPSQGLSGYVPQGLDVRVEGMNTVSLGGQSPFSADTGWFSFGGGIREFPEYSYFNGFLPLSTWLADELNVTGTNYATYNTKLLNYYSKNINLTVASIPTLPNGVSFVGGNLTFSIRDRNSGTVIQTAQVAIPSTTVNLASLELSCVGVDGVTPTAPTVLCPTLADVYAYKLSLWRGYKFHPAYDSWQVFYGVFIDPWKAARNACDVVRSVILGSGTAMKGDFRIAAASKSIPATWFSKATGAVTGAYDIATEKYVHDFKITHHGAESYATWVTTPGGSNFRRLNEGKPVAGAAYTTTQYTSGAYRPEVYADLNGTIMHNGFIGDFDTGIGNFGDGAFINKPDESVRVSTVRVGVNTNGQEYNISNPANNINRGIHFAHYAYNQLPDIQSVARVSDSSVWYSPSRQLASPVMFGSLSSGVKRVQPWQTFLFSPNSAADCDQGGKVHPGWGGGTPDHLLLDYFRMPVAEPYAISDPLSTSGKININFEIMPFRYLKRASGIHALLKAVKLPNIPTAAASVYKSGALHSTSYRASIDLNETVKSFEERFQTSAGAYRTDSELCEVPLYPVGLSYSKSGSTYYEWWKARAVTGDNLREEPYMSIYPRITTRSNVFTMHVWAQALKKSKATNPHRWENGTDRVTGEYRGSFTIERYVNPQREGMPDFAKDPTKRLSDYYQFRVIQSKTIVP